MGQMIGTLNFEEYAVNKESKVGRAYGVEHGTQLSNLSN